MCSLQDFEKGVSDVQSRDVIEMMMITQYFDMLKVSLLRRSPLPE